MSEKNQNLPEKSEDDGRAGFKINLPFGLGWLRGDGSHMSMLMPTVRWILILASAWFIVSQVSENLK